jgi:hypothetical protein
MKQLMRKLAILGIVMFVVMPDSWSGEFNYASYTRTNLQAIIAEEKYHSFIQAEIKEPADSVDIECRVYKYRVLCNYTNIQRPISEKRKTAIKIWMDVLRINPKLASLYQREILVSEGMRVYWIPIQETFFPYLQKVLGKNDTIELFIILIGKVESEFVFVATEFEKPIFPVTNLIQATARTRVAP